MQAHVSFQVHDPSRREIYIEDDSRVREAEQGTPTLRCPRIRSLFERAENHQSERNNQEDEALWLERENTIR